MLGKKILLAWISPQFRTVFFLVSKHTQKKANATYHVWKRRRTRYWLLSYLYFIEECILLCLSESNASHKHEYIPKREKRKGKYIIVQLLCCSSFHQSSLFARESETKSCRHVKEEGGKRLIGGIDGHSRRRGITQSSLGGLGWSISIFTSHSVRIQGR